MNDNQRVSIQYSIGIQELPEEVMRLLTKTQSQLNELIDQSIPELLGLSRENVLSLNTLTDVAVVRKKVSLADHILRDIENIVSGFVSYRVHETQPENEELQQPEPSPSDVIADTPPFDPASQGSPPTMHPGMPQPAPGMNAKQMADMMAGLGNMDMSDLKEKIQLMKAARDERADELPGAPNKT